MSKFRVCSPDTSTIHAVHYGQCRLERCVARSLNLWEIRYTQNDNAHLHDEEAFTLKDEGYPLFTGEHPKVMQEWLNKRGI